MIIKGEQYQPKTAYVFPDEKRKQIASILRKIAKLGLDPKEPGIFYKKDWKQSRLITRRLINVSQNCKATSSLK